MSCSKSASAKNIPPTKIDPEERLIDRRKPEPRKPSKWPLLLAVVVTIIIASGSLLHIYINYLPSKPIIFTPEQLSKYKGAWRGRILIAILGKVFDVTPGRRHYGIGSAYHGFAGRDSSKAYITGEFVKDLHDDVAHFTPEECAELVRWREFYTANEEYKYKGKLIGRFYDTQGKEQSLLHLIESKARIHKDLKDAEKLAEELTGDRFCRVRWSRSEGGWVHCGEKSYPRRVKLPLSSSDMNAYRTAQGVDDTNDNNGDNNDNNNDDNSMYRFEERCACFSDLEVSDNRQLYDGCSVESESCQTSLPDGEL